MTKARGSFQVTSMHEDTYEELEGDAKLTRAWGEQRFAGDLEGDGTVQWFEASRGTEASYELEVELG